MEKEYDNYLEKVLLIPTAEMAGVAMVRADLIRKYKAGRNLPQLGTAVLIFKKYKIDYEFWVVHNQNWKKKQEEKENE